MAINGFTFLSGVALCKVYGVSPSLGPSFLLSDPGFKFSDSQLSE